MASFGAAKRRGDFTEMLPHAFLIFSAWLCRGNYPGIALSVFIWGTAHRLFELPVEIREVPIAAAERDFRNHPFRG